MNYEELVNELISRSEYFQAQQFYNLSSLCSKAASAIQELLDERKKEHETCTSESNNAIGETPQE